jgi:two-component system, OmpR family, response regulator MprA
MRIHSRARSKQRVAVVEDDRAIRELLARILEVEGFEVVALSEGATAFERIKASRCHAVILDVQLPGRDGLQITQQIRSHAETSALPILMVTGRADDQSTWNGWKAGVNYYMPKPFDPQELLIAIRRAIDGATPAHR